MVQLTAGGVGAAADAGAVPAMTALRWVLVGSPSAWPTSQVPSGVMVKVVVSASHSNSRAVASSTGPIPSTQAGSPGWSSRRIVITWGRCAATAGRSPAVAGAPGEFDERVEVALRGGAVVVG